MYEELAKELKKNTQIIQTTFSKFNLQVLQVGYRPYAEEGDDEPDADCDFMIEISSLDNAPMKCNAYIKINLYDENGDLIDHDNKLVIADEFSGFDTFKIMMTNDSKTLLRAKSAKVYMSMDI